MTEAIVLDKVRKLLRLSTSNNAHEAALAAAKAQELIDRHQLAAALLTLDQAEPTKGLDDEPIIDFEKASAPLDQQQRRERWRTSLASVIARQNGCRIYFRGGDIALVGRPSDAETVRYLYAYLAREVERLTTEQGKGMGRPWRNNFRLGVVDTVTTKLNAARQAFAATARAEARADSSVALMRVDRALAKVDQRGRDVEQWMKTNLKLYSSGGSRASDNPNARAMGRRAGQAIVVGGDRARLTSAAKKLEAATIRHEP